MKSSSMPPQAPTLDPRGIGYVYCQMMKKYPERVAQCDAITEEQQTYGELLQSCFDTAFGMERHGIKPGDFISICSLNHLDVSAPYVASLFTGAITASVDPTMSASEIIYLLNQVEPKIIFVGFDAVDLVEEVVEELPTKPLIVVFGESDKHISFSKFAKPSNEEYTVREPNDLDETALVIFSSGTTGKPKGICHTHKSMLSAVKEPLVNSEFTMTSLSNPYWISFYISFAICIRNGLRKLVFRSFDSSNPWGIFKHKIDFIMTNTTQALTFLSHEKPDDINVDSLRLFYFGGNYISVEQLLALRQKFPKSKVLSMYGQSELFATLFISFADPRSQDLIQKHPNSVGIFRSDISWKIVDIETEKVLGPNEQGELRVKANFQCKGYYNRDSSDTFDSEGYLKTGDLGYYNEDMGFFVVNRIKESFKYMHHHIIPSEIERVLLTHPSIERVVVLGVPHDMDTNHPMAVVQLKKKGDSVSEKDIVKYVEERVLDKNRLRAGVKIVDKIPITVTEKVHRLKLREMVLHNEM